MNNDKPKKKSCYKKYITAAVVSLFIFIAVFIFMANKWHPKPNPASEKNIRQVVAEQLNKDPNELTKEDFEKILKLDIYNTELYDIYFLEKFTNLQELMLRSVRIPKKIPKWKVFLVQFGIIKADSLDLSPLKKLTKLTKLIIFDVEVKDINSLATLNNLEVLSLCFIHISDLESIKNLANLNTFILLGTPIKSLESIKELNKLQTLSIRGCDNITEQQVEELRKSFPDLNIDYGPFNR